MNLNQLNYKQCENNSQYENQPFGSMPREANSLRKIRFIHVAKALSPSLFACSSNCWRNSSVSLIWYCCDLFSFLVDIVITPNYYGIQCNYIITVITITNKASVVLEPLKKPLTNNLTKDKTMANPNITPYTAQGASKIYFLFTTEQKNILQSLAGLSYADNVVAKSTTEPENSNDLSVANSSTPLNRAFFVRGLHTPKESAVKFDGIFSTHINQSKIGSVSFLSMVACSGKGFALCCVPLIAVSQPVTRYRPKPENFQAVTSSKPSVELSAMIYLFNVIKRTDFNNTALNIHTFPKSIIRVQAESLEQAKRLLSRDYFAVNTGQISPKFNHTFEGVIYA